MYTVVHPEIWGPTLPAFELPAPLPTGLAVTPSGSEHDARFSRSWHLLAADPGLGKVDLSVIGVAVGRGLGDG